MNTVQKIEHWGDVHHAKWLDSIRIVLGLFLLVKGIAFIADIDVLQDLILRKNAFQFSSVLIIALVHYVAFAHLVGGIMLMLGLLTRFAAAVQIPILLGAVFFVNQTQQFTMLNSELWLSIVTLLLLILFLILGSGEVSLDRWMKTHKT